MSIADDVLEFRLKLHLPVGVMPLLLEPSRTSFYARFLMEELSEFLVAHEERDIVKAADALGDMVYLLYGCAAMMGIPLDAVLQAIHESNMQKELGTSKRGKNDAIKPPGWVGPEKKIQDILMRASR